ncbi:hypothetical protein LTR78_002130 [Recurvomyces mirabilis]|uniref:Xylanolytic transcriptional activator regulatory domain-containing protein n=1 Tax=Recurvomyces mirabilis TaxID=574656 RepID=A0AAE1C4U7_9PEZI|nr:hypothetical protein LTR78_002130 [Recurvomyces mirabilis]KAK5160587.1 hypothetical protein LTS14_001599 [Recurvomyces mirabilis]
MSGEQGAHDAGDSSPGDTLQPHESDSTPPRSANASVKNEASTPSSSVNPSDRLMPDLAKKYIGGSFWSSLTDEVNALADVLDNDDLLNDNDISGRRTADQCANEDIDRWDVARLLNAYSQNVEPPHKLFHVPSLRALVISAAPYLHKPADAPSNQFLKASVCFAGLNALTDDECWAWYGMPKEQAVQEFRSVVDLALHRADPLVSTDMATLQALLLYAITIRITDPSRRSWSIVGFVAHTARSMYLHRATPNESPYMSQPGQTWKQRLDLAEQYRAKLDREVRPICERSLPRHQYIMEPATIVCNSMVLRAVRPLHLDGEESPPSVSDPWVLRIGVDLLQSALQLLPFVEKGWRRMPWIPWHAVVVVLAGLCTIRDTDLANQAWPVVEKAMTACEADVADTKDGMLWRPIKKVHAKAVAYRKAGNIQVTEHFPSVQAFDGSIAGIGYQHDFGDINSFTQLDAIQNTGYVADSSGAPSNGVELPLPDDSWLNWETIMTDLGADETLFRDVF